MEAGSRATGGAASGGDPFSLAGLRVLVTGASGALGAAVAAEAARGGATVVVTGRDAARLAAVREGLAGAGHESVAADLLSPPDVAALVEAAGILDGVVHAAGVLRLAPFRMAGPELRDAVMRGNFEAPAALVQVLLRRRRLREGASVVIVSSVAAVRGAKGHAPYSAAKAALVGWARSLALELAPQRVRVNCVLPGMVRTPMAERTAAVISDEAMERHVAEYPLGIGEPVDVACAVRFLLSPAARWITGVQLVLDGGYTAG